jgi:hypothetical protein
LSIAGGPLLPEKDLLTPFESEKSGVLKTPGMGLAFWIFHERKN